MSKGLAVVLALAASLSLVLATGEASGEASFPEGFAREQVAEGLADPTAMTFLPDGRLLVAQQNGRLRVIRDGRLLEAPALELRVDSRGERGLLGVAVDPAFTTNGHIYVYHTVRTGPIHNRVTRFTLEGDRVAPGSGRLVFRLNNLSRATNHNGGAIHFGQDGKLYVAVGDNANGENAQSLRNLKGKMLRINNDGSIPRDNPFRKNKNVRGKNKAIWARGLRNPFSFAVSPDDGVIFINDVGQRKWEEINRGKRGANYGWPVFEGPEKNRRYAPPVFAYRHGDGPTTGCAITGGTFYVPQTPQFPEEYVGDYFFADFCGGWVRRFDPASGRAEPFAQGLSFPVDLKAGPEGALYYLERGKGSVSRVSYTG
ncbi:MAG: PQQ-dependent sugar dehydrogenase [Rubrobacteraceae bacterium]